MSRPRKSVAEFLESDVPSRFAEVSSAFAGQTSPGSTVLHVPELGSWSFWLEQGALRWERAARLDAIVQVTLHEEDFERLVIESLVRASGQDLVKVGGRSRALTLDEEMVEIVRTVPGTLALVIEDEDATRRVYITPGNQTPNVTSPDCVVKCSMEQLEEMQANHEKPSRMFFEGKLKITGNVQVALALAGALG